VILCADDYGISAGVTRSILELAGARRLSATSAMVTLPRWKEDGSALKAIRDRTAIGLHLNLTVGAPLGPLPSLAPDGQLPGIDVVVKAALLGRFKPGEIEAEVDRQLDAFEQAVGFPPDHIDGHQHVHALPRVRHAFLDAVSRRWRGAAVRPLIRDPWDRPSRIARRGRAMGKALGIAVLVAGFGQAARRCGMPTNIGFSGFSDFELGRSYREELVAAMAASGPRHLIMCHPGYADPELAAVDPVTKRREEEHAALMADESLPARIWHASRPAEAPPIDWSGVSHER
jgi:chitin disaccharide deacetylase